MHRTVCFRRPLAGTPHHRYYIGRPDGQGGFTVSAVRPPGSSAATPSRTTTPNQPSAAKRPGAAAARIAASPAAIASARPAN